MDVRDVIRRAAKTALQVFLASFPVDAIFAGDAGLLEKAALAGASAAVAVIHNALLAYASSD